MRHVVHFARRAGNGTLGVVHSEREQILSGILVSPKVRRLRYHHIGIEQITVDADVEQFWLRSLLSFAYTDFFHGDAFADQTVRIVQITGQNRLGRTDHLAGRLVAHVDSRSIEIALGRRVAVRIDVKRVVGAGLHARLAADAALVVEIDDAVGAAE